MTNELLDAWADEQDARRKARQDNPVRRVAKGTHAVPAGGYRLGMAFAAAGSGPTRRPEAGGHVEAREPQKPSRAVTAYAGVGVAK